MFFDENQCSIRFLILWYGCTASCFFHNPTSPLGWGGLARCTGLSPPQDPRPSPRRVVGDSYCDFFGNLVALLFCIVFRCLFGSILAPFCFPTCPQKSTKIQEKSMPRCHPSWTPFFDRFLVGFGSQLGPIWSKRHDFSLGKIKFFEKSAFKVHIDFWSHFGLNLASFGKQKPTKFVHKSTPRGINKKNRFLHRIFIDFWSILEANLEPCWPLFRSKRGEAERAEGGLCWVYLLFRFFGRPGPLLAPSGLDLGGFGPPFWRFLVPIFFTISKFFPPTFSASLALCWSIFFTKIWFVMGWWGYAKCKDFLRFYKSYSLYKAPSQYHRRSFRS